MGCILSYLHMVQPGVSACCADAKRRDLLTRTAFSLSCTPVTIFCYDSDQSQSKHCNFYVARWGYAQLRSDDGHSHVHMKLLMFSTCTRSGLPHNVVHSSSYYIRSH